MSYKNSVKLLASNFSIVWKQLVYGLVVLLVTAGLTFAVAQPLINILKDEGVLKEIGSIFNKIYTSPKEVVLTTSDAFNHLVGVIIDNIKSLWLSLTGIAIVLGVVYQLLRGIAIYNISSVMFMKMTSFTEIGYTRSLISNLLTATRYSLVRIVMKIPFVLLKFLILFTFFRVVSTPLSVILGIFIVVLLLVLFNSLELAVFAGGAANLLENGGSAFKAFFKGSLVIFKKFARVFSNALILTLTMVFINLFLGIFTLGVALIITLPACIALKCIFGLTAYFNSRGERYYLSKNVVVSPTLEETN